jgi:hypothetical protein
MCKIIYCFDVMQITIRKEKSGTNRRKLMAKLEGKKEKLIFAP